ncbi:hypothetical protein BLOT_007596 [Blomia tropicalis]|nr:hypothetical protein BLOT_007596 [Blomia tropicalis]
MLFPLNKSRNDTIMVVYSSIRLLKTDVLIQSNRTNTISHRIKLIKRLRRASIKTAHLNPSYPLKGVHRNDIAIIKLWKPITVRRPLKNYLVNLDMNRYDPVCNSSVRFYGFGQTYEYDNGHNQFWKKRLQTMETMVINRCSNFNGKITDNDDFIVTNSMNRTSFYGDSGGPLISIDGKQIGIATGMGNRAGLWKQFDNYFVRISNHAEFISNHL